MLEREIKLLFNTPDEARAAVARAGAVPLRPRRLQQDTLFDTEDQALRRRGCALRIRSEGGVSVLTFKGPVQPGPMKLREEHESPVENGEALWRILEGLGYSPWFRYEKYREEYRSGDVTIAVDETPVGTFVELEGDEAGILRVSGTLGRSADDFILGSYRTLFLSRRERLRIEGNDMVFGDR